MRKKTSRKPVRTRRKLTRRHALGALAAGGALLALRSAGATDLLDTSEEAYAHYVSWDDGWAYPITGYDETYGWIVEFDDGEYGVDPAGFVFDSGVWYPVLEVDAEGIWYYGDDDYAYLLEYEFEYVDIANIA